MIRWIIYIIPKSDKMMIVVVVAEKINYYLAISNFHIPEELKSI